MKQLMSLNLDNANGSTQVEYVLIAAILNLVILLGVQTLGAQSAQSFKITGDAIADQSSAYAFGGGTQGTPP